MAVLELGHLRFDDLAALGKALSQIARDADNLEARSLALFDGQFNVVTQLARGQSHLALINFSGVTNGSDHFALLQGGQTSRASLRDVEDGAMGVELRIKGSAGFMSPERGAELASQLVVVGPSGSAGANAHGGEAFQFGHGQAHSPVMSLGEARVAES